LAQDGQLVLTYPTYRPFQTCRRALNAARTFDADLAGLIAVRMASSFPLGKKVNGPSTLYVRKNGTFTVYNPLKVQAKIVA
jgi:hypothetical protein